MKFIQSGRFCFVLQHIIKGKNLTLNVEKMLQEMVIPRVAIKKQRVPVGPEGGATVSVLRLPTKEFL